MGIRVKSYCRLNLPRSSVFNFERLDILRVSIGHTRKKLLRFEFQRASVFNTSVSIYYGTQTDIRVKFYCLLNSLRASVLNYERLDILRDTIGQPSKNLLSFEFATSFCFQLRASRYTTGHSQTSE